MNRLKIINQPLRVSGSTLDELDEQIQTYWDHKAENLAVKRERQQRKGLKEAS